MKKAKKEISSTHQIKINLPYITADNTEPKHLTIKVIIESLVLDLIYRAVTLLKRLR